MPPESYLPLSGLENSCGTEGKEVKGDKREENIPMFHQFDFKVQQAIRTKVLEEKASSLPLGGNELPLFRKALGDRGLTQLVPLILGSPKA